MDLILDEHNNDNEPVRPAFCQALSGCDEVLSLLANMSPVLDDTLFYYHLNARAQLGQFQMSIGLTVADLSPYVDSSNDRTDTDNSLANSSHDSLSSNEDLLFDHHHFKTYFFMDMFFATKKAGKLT